MVSDNKEVEYSGFATPSLILEESDTEKRGSIIDKYAKTKDQDGLLCGEWVRGFEDGLIHIYLFKPVAAICDERQKWAAKQTFLKAPINYMPPSGSEIVSQKSTRKKPVTEKRKMILDPVTKQFRLEM